MAKKTTSQKHAELKRLSADVKRNIYEMLRLTDEIMSDKAYVDKHGGESSLLAAIEQSEFSHFGGSPKLGTMLRAYRANPSLETWSEYDYNLRVMIDLATPERDRGEATRINWKSKCAELEERVQQLTAALEESQESNRALRSKCDELLQQIGEMRGRVKAVSESRMVGAI